MTYVTTNDEIWQDLEEDTEGLLDEWHVDEGEQVEAGQSIASIVLIKANYEITAPTSGVISKILVAAQDSFTKGQNLAEID